MSKQVLAIGDTGAELVSKFNTNATELYNRSRVYNVKEYGVAGDGNTDDTVAIQNLMNALYAANGGVMYFPNGIYVIGGALQRDIGGIDYKSQLYVPSCDVYAPAVAKTVTFKGETYPTYLTNTFGHQGAVLKSTISNVIDGASVICSKGDAANFLGFNYNNLFFEDISIQPTYIYTEANGNHITIGGIDCGKASKIIARNVTIYPYGIQFAQVGEPINNCIGIVMPQVMCDTPNMLENVYVVGMETAYKCGEHGLILNADVHFCRNGYEITNNFHPVIMIRPAAHSCVNTVKCTANGYFTMIGLTVEWHDDNKWWKNIYGILDDLNRANGTITLNCIGPNGLDNSLFVKSGGTGVRVLPMAVRGETITLSTGTDSEKIASIISVLKAQGLAV